MATAGTRVGDLTGRSRLLKPTALLRRLSHPPPGTRGPAALEGCGHAFPIAEYFSFHFEYHLFGCHGNVKSLF